MNDVMYQLYRVSGNPAHLTMAHLFDAPVWFTPLMNSTDALAGQHANTHLALTVGGAQRYATMQDNRYRQATDFFVRTLRGAHSYATGGSSYREFWQTAHTQASTLFEFPEVLVSSLQSSASSAALTQRADHGGNRGKPGAQQDERTSNVSGDRFAGHDNEESCTTYNLLKIVRHLFTWTASPGYLEIYNHALTNGVLGIQRGREPGVMLYLLPLGRRVTKGNSSRGWGTPFNSFWCCYGTGIESFSKLVDSIYFRGNDDAVVVARYTPSSVDFHPRMSGVAVRLVQTGGSNDTNVLSVKFRESTCSFALRLLIPSWAVSPVVAVNGAPLPPHSVIPGAFAAVDRGWRSGDTVVVTLPAIVRLCRLDDARPEYTQTFSFAYGDRMLVGVEHGPGGDGVNDSLVVPSLDPTAWVRRLPGPPLRFRVNANRIVTLMPLNEVVNETYSVYYSLITSPHD